MRSPVLRRTRSLASSATRCPVVPFEEQRPGCGSSVQFPVSGTKIGGFDEDFEDLEDLESE